MAGKTIMHVEVTDTYGGEANYSWVTRCDMEVPAGASDLSLVRRAKALAGWNGVKCRTENTGEMFILHPRRICQVMFITFDYDAQ